MRWLAVASAFASLLLSMPVPVGAQPAEDPLSEVERLVGTLPEDVQFEIAGAELPNPWNDQTGDFEHPSGEVAGFTPDFIDIVSVTAVELSPGWDLLFGPTDDVAGSWSVGQRLIDAGDEVLQTFTGDSAVRDGSQFIRGAYLFGIRLGDALPAAVDGRCEFVVWAHDIRNTAEWENQLPLDPAVGTNVAFGLGLNPEGESGTFALELTEPGGVFEPSFEFDVRALVAGDFIGLFVPTFAVAEFDALNISSFCAEAGFGFEAEVSGADQLGVIELAPEELVVFSVVATPTSTTTAPSDTLVDAVDSPTTSTRPQDDDGLRSWGLSLIGAAALAALALAVVRRTRSER